MNHLLFFVIGVYWCACALGWRQEREQGQGAGAGAGAGTGAAGWDRGREQGQQVIDVWGGGFWLTGRCHFHNIPTCLGMQNK